MHVNTPMKLWLYSQDSKLTLHPRKSLHAPLQIPSFHPSLPPLAHQRDVFSVMCISLNVLKFYKWNYIVCTLFCLAFFSQQRLFWDLAVPLCASVIYSFLLLRSISLNVYTMLEDTFRPPLRLLRLSPKLGTKSNKKL